MDRFTTAAVCFVVVTWIFGPICGVVGFALGWYNAEKQQ